MKSNKQLSSELKLSQKRYHFLQEAASESSKEVTQLKECIDTLHTGLVRRCGLEGDKIVLNNPRVCLAQKLLLLLFIIDENDSLKNQIAAMKESAHQLEQEHKKQMTDALDNLQRAQELHKKELQEVQENTKQHSQLSCDSSCDPAVMPSLNIQCSER